MLATNLAELAVRTRIYLAYSVQSSGVFAVFIPKKIQASQIEQRNSVDLEVPTDAIFWQALRSQMFINNPHGYDRRYTKVNKWLALGTHCGIPRAAYGMQ